MHALITRVVPWENEAKKLCAPVSLNTFETSILTLENSQATNNNRKKEEKNFGAEQTHFCALLGEDSLKKGRHAHSSLEMERRKKFDY